MPSPGRVDTSAHPRQVKEGLLHHVLGRLAVPQQEQRVAVQVRSVLVIQFGKQSIGQQRLSG